MKFKALLLVTIGLIIALAGICTPGLWPWQLPASVIGGSLFGIGLKELADKYQKSR